jgi:putative transposase
VNEYTVVATPATAAMLFWTLLASGQITLRKVDRWHTFDERLAQPIDLAT